MKKAVWKLAPYEPFEVDAIAGWLDEMSQNSLQFRTRFGPICVFDRKASTARYRVDIRRESDCDRTDGERFALYREMGWEYCSDYGGRAEIYRAEDSNAPELHTDAEVLRELVQSCCRSYLTLLILFAWEILYIIYNTIQLIKSWSDWDAAMVNPVNLTFLIACGAFCAALLLTIILLLIKWLRLRRHDYRCDEPHTAQRARRGAVWLLVRLVLIGLFVLYIPFTILTFLL